MDKCVLCFVLFFPKLDLSRCLRLSVKLHFDRTSGSHMLRVIFQDTYVNSNLQF